VVRRAVFFAVLLVTVEAHGSCPCYAPGSSSNTYNCGVDPAPGTNPTVAEWGPIFQLVSGGPTQWGTQGPSVADIGQGCNMPEPTHSVAAIFPCELLRAIAMQESGWRQFCLPDTPADEAKPPVRTIISFDCGYGVGQVTSGMHVGEMPMFDRARVASDPTYNLATGTLILADKWRATNCVGDNQPRIVEDWYVATWAYNGLAYVNNPNNPNYDASRTPCDPNAGCTPRPYQELIWGWMEFPPDAQHWASMAPAYPDRGQIGSSGVPPNLPEPSCAGPTDCANHRSVHVSACLGSSSDGGVDGGGSGADGGVIVDGGPGDGGGGGGGGSGCACEVGGRAGAPLFLVLIALGVVVRRRRA
jgi:MYXO-CTERM domain-containing protein